MNQSEKTRSLLISHYNDYPLLQVTDIFKFLYQSSFGCEHLVSCAEAMEDYITKEFAEFHREKEEATVILDGDYCRVPLSCLNRGLCAKTLARLFVLSAKKEENGLENLKEKLGVAKELILEGLLPFSASEFDKALNEWQEKGYPAVHHSDIFRNAYRPSYRVISSDFVPFLPLFAEIDKRITGGKLTIAIEGGSASGKSTLGKLLEDIYGCTLFHMDDFFLRPEQRTPERFKEIGGNIDHERFLSEVLLPLGKGEKVVFRRFDCSTMSLLEEETVIPKNLVIVEGAYSMHPNLSEHYDFSVFLDISEELQKQRILRRNTPHLAQRFFDEWIPLEKAYFEKTDIKNRCDLSIEIKCI